MSAVSPVGPSPSAARDSIGHVLVIDDDPVVQDLMKSFLTREGYTVTLADSGPAGLLRARELKPDVITLDVAMPGMDGWSVLAALKHDPELREIPVVILTMSDNKSLGYALGATEYLMKPIDRERLASVLRKYSRLSHNPILVVEDDPNTRDLLRSMLTKDGWSVQTAENGRSALEKVTNTRPGLVLLDLMMPEMDGFTFLEEFRKLAFGGQGAGGGAHREGSDRGRPEAVERPRPENHGQGRGNRIRAQESSGIGAQCLVAAPALESRSIRSGESSGKHSVRQG